MAKKKNTSQKNKTISLFQLLTENLYYVAIYSLLFFVTINLYLYSNTYYPHNYTNSDNTKTVLAAEDETDFDSPRLVSELPTTFPVVSAQGVMVYDINSGVSLFEKNADEALLPASTVKMMTSIIVVENMELSTVIQVGNVSVVGQKMGLVTGEEMTVENLLNAMLVYSANDAAEVLASNFPGGRDVFVSAMNRKADELNLQNTYYTNPSGLDGYTQVTSARDLVKIGNYMLANPILSEIIRKQSVVVENQLGYKRTLSNTNVLLGDVEGVAGIKTGWTENARENLVIYVERGERQVVFALLGSQDRFGEMKQLINWVFDNYDWE